MTLRILVVEPEPHAREGLRAILSSQGHEVSVAADIPAGFAHLVAQPFDLLLLDADLPPSRNVLVGVLDLLRLARQGNPGVCGIVIVSCAEDLPADPAGQRCLTILEKPVEPSRLRLALEAATSRKGSDPPGERGERMPAKSRRSPAVSAWRETPSPDTTGEP